MADKGKKDSSIEKTRDVMKVKLHTNNNERQWSDLPLELILLILAQLNLSDYFLLTGVCKIWNSFIIANRKDFIIDQAPHLIVAPTPYKRNVQLRNIFDGSTFDTKLPLSPGRRCYGFACGHLVMEHISKFSGVWLVNPLTRSEYRHSRLLFRPYRVLMASSSNVSSSSCDIIVTVSRDVWFGNPRGVLMFEVSISTGLIYKGVLCIKNQPVNVMDVAIFEGRIYVLFEKGRIGIFSVPCCKLVGLQEDPMIELVSSSPRLVASDGELIVVDFKNIYEFKIYKLKLEKLEYVKMASLGGKALFTCEGRLTSIAICKTSHWKGHSNCIYNICYRTNRCYCYALNGRLIASYPIGERGNCTEFGLKKPIWYFPHEAYSFPYLRLD